MRFWTAAFTCALTLAVSASCGDSDTSDRPAPTVATEVDGVAGSLDRIEVIEPGPDRRILAESESDLWFVEESDDGSEATLTAFDTSSGELTAEVGITGSSFAGAATADSLWVAANGDDGIVVTRIDADSRQPVAEFGYENEGVASVAVVNGEVFMVLPEDRLVTRIDQLNNSIADELRVDGLPVAVDGHGDHAFIAAVPGEGSDTLSVFRVGLKGSGEAELIASVQSAGRSFAVVDGRAALVGQGSITILDLDSGERAQLAVDDDIRFVRTVRGTLIAATESAESSASAEDSDTQLGELLEVDVRGAEVRRAIDVGSVIDDGAVGPSGLWLQQPDGQLLLLS